jgi:molecular chaperone DnaK (HSP70)
MDETRFILGVDLGDAASNIAYFDAHRAQPEIMDISGGYGKPASPTAVQYIPETKEWVFGEYAVSTDGGVTLNRLVSRLGRGEPFVVASRPYGAAEALGMFINDLIGNCRNVNPKAEIVGMSVCVPDDLSDDGAAELASAFALCGFCAAPPSFVPSRRCAIEYYHLDKPFKRGHIIIFDFAARAFRMGVYGVAPEDGGAVLTCLSADQDEALSVYAVSERTRLLFERHYRDGMGLSENETLSEQAAWQLKAFARQHMDMLFSSKKPVKLYYNFAYPPFQKTALPEDADLIAEQFKKGLTVFIKARLAECPEARLGDLTVLCLGGGFDMRWARGVITEIFPFDNVVFPKNPKGAFAEGACAEAAARLGAAPVKNITIIDQNTVKDDIGVCVTSGGRERFIPLVYKNASWRGRGETRLFYLAGENAIPLIKRSASGELIKLLDIQLSGLPARPPGATKISVSAGFETYNMLTVTVTDLGFGETFRKTDFKRSVSVIVD